MAQAGEEDYKDETKKGKPNIQFWISQLEAAKAAKKRWEESSKRAWDEYLGGKADRLPIRDQDNKTPPSRYPIFWSSIKTIQPMLYSQTPKEDIEKVFDDLEDNIARLGSLSLERLSKYLKRMAPFDRVQYATRDDFIMTGKTTNRVCFDSNIKQEPKKKYYVQTQAMGPDGVPMPVWVDSEGTPMPQDAPIGQDETGVYIEIMEESIDYTKVELLPVNYQDYLHTPNARHWEEIDWIAFKSLMDKDECIDTFGKEQAEKIKYLTYSRQEEKDGSPEEKGSLPIQFACIWEIWNRKKKEVYWMADGYTEDFLTPLNYEGGDPYELCGFFPCPPFMLGTTGPDHLYPVPDFVQLEPIILQLHGMAQRLRRLVRAVRRRGVYDESVEELKRLEDETDEAEFLGVANFKELIGDGGLEAIVKYFPVETIVQATEQMAQIIALYEEKFNELYGIPDILRGASDPTETAAAQQLKGHFLSVRASMIQKEFQRLVRDDLELMCDLALKKFPEEKLIQIMGVRRWSPEDQQYWPQVLLLLRDDQERKIRINIETDSTITMNQQAEMAQRNELAQSFFQGLSAVAQVSQNSPEAVPAAFQVLLLAIQGLPKGKEVEQTLRQTAMQMMQPKEQQPDPAMMKAQADVQANQQKLQAQLQFEEQKMMMQAQIDERRETLEAIRAEKEFMQKMQLEEFDARHQWKLKELEAELALMKAQIGMEQDARKAMMKDQEQKSDKEKDYALKLMDIEGRIKAERDKAANELLVMQQKAAADLAMKEKELALKEIEVSNARNKTVRKSAVLTPMPNGQMHAEVVEKAEGE